VAGVDPDIMAIGPVPASRQALHRAGLGIQELDLVGRRRGRFGLASLCIGGGQGIAMVVEALHD
jgi:acetyl-CoA acetyltransferase